MKIFAFTDTHGHAEALSAIEKKIKKENPDVVVCAGDFTVFGQHQHLILKQMNSWKKPLLLIHGNHEIEEEVAEDCQRLKWISFLHKHVKEIKGILFAGYGGGGFALHDKAFLQFTKNIPQEKPLILITHGPPYGTILDRITGEHCGNKSYLSFIKRRKPLVVISGHLHENNGKRQVWKSSFLINPGPEGELIDLNAIQAMLKQQPKRKKE